MLFLLNGCVTVDPVLEDPEIKLRLDGLFVSLAHERFEHDRWSDAYHDGLRHLITSPRDVVRLVDSLSVSLPPVLRDVSFRVAAGERVSVTPLP